MGTLLWAAALLIGGWLPLTAAPAELAVPHRSDRILAKSRAGVERAQIERWQKVQGTAVLRAFPGLDDLQVIELPAGMTVREGLQLYRKSGWFEFVEPDPIISINATPDDPRFKDGTLWGLNNTGQHGGIAGADIRAVPAWQAIRTAEEVVVAVIDSGVRYTHEDLAPNMWKHPVTGAPGLNALTGSSDPMDDIGHGTHVAGIIGAVGDNAKGVTGVAWRVQIMALKFMDSDGQGAVSDAIKCIDFARMNGAHIINASWGSYTSSSSLRLAIDKARQAGILFVAASGNDAGDNDGKPIYPAGYKLDNIISVAATTRTDALADYSNFGASSVHLAAPGSAIFSTWNSSDSSYGYSSGTSMAAPYVTGALALMRARFPDAHYRELIEKLLAATDPLPSLAGKCATGGRLNLSQALGAGVLADFSVDPQTGNVPLMVKFTDTSVGDITRWEWDFGDGSPRSSEQHPSHLYEQEGNFTAVLTVFDSTGSSSSKSRVITSFSNYTMDEAPYNWVDPSGMIELALARNGVSPAQPLPFPFRFYGQTYDAIYVSANGMAGFINQRLDSPSNTDLPDSRDPNGMLCVYWDDLNPASGGSVRIGAVGIAPNRRMVISWVEVRHALPGRPVSFTFQAILEEESHEIVFQYAEAAPGHNRGAGRHATIGIENPSGIVASKYSYNGSALLRNGQAIRFRPATSSGMSISPAANWSAAGPVGGPFSPEEITCSIENIGTDTLHWTVDQTQEWISLSAQSGSLGPGESTAVLARINALADDLPPGSYLEKITFVNTSTGLGNTSRMISLAVNGVTGILELTPESNFNSSGPQGGPFTPGSRIYTLVNDGDATLEWAAETDQEWLDLSNTSGVLAAGESATVSLFLSEDATTLPPGQYEAEATFVNLTNGLGDTTRKVNLEVTVPLSLLDVYPVEDQLIQLAPGASPEPDGIQYTLLNTGAIPLHWRAMANAEWLSFSQNEGVLQPEETFDLFVFLEPHTAGIDSGVHQLILHFLDQANEYESLTRNIWLHLEDAPSPSPKLAISMENGILQVRIVAAPERQYVIEMSEELQFWAPVQDGLIPSEGYIDFIDSSPKTGRFYRAILLP